MDIVRRCNNQLNYCELFQPLRFWTDSLDNGKVSFKCTLGFVMKDLFYFFQESVFPNIHTRQKAAQVRSCKCKAHLLITVGWKCSWLFWI